MKSLMLFLIVSVATFMQITENTLRDYDNSVEKEIVTMNDIINAISVDIPETPCSDSNLCSCVAAGNCKWDPTANGCYIIFCDGHVESDPDNSKASSVTVITVPCEAG